MKYSTFVIELKDVRNKSNKSFEILTMHRPCDRATFTSWDKFFALHCYNP